MSKLKKYAVLTASLRVGFGVGLPPEHDQAALPLCQPARSRTLRNTGLMLLSHFKLRFGQLKIAHLKMHGLNDCDSYVELKGLQGHFRFN
jgi:hypothetical protein